MVHRFRDFARIVSDHSLRVKPGEVVLVHFGNHAFPLAEEVAVAIRASGGFPLLSVTTDSLQKRLILDVPEEYLRQPPNHWIRWADDISATLMLGGLDDPQALADVPESRWALLSKAGKEYREKVHSRRVRTLIAAFPTPKSADFYGLPFDRFNDLVWDALLVDYQVGPERECTSVCLERGGEGPNHLRFGDRHLLPPEGKAHLAR
ncbi:MAG: aminopeptidase [Armatimonadetes bacterium]|nr:aminopeptidase [Armatimonadota bacterium]